MEIVDYILVICVLIIVGSFVNFVLNLYKEYHIAQLNLNIVDLYLSSSTMSQEEVDRTREILDDAEGITNQIYIDTLRILLNAREHILKEIADEHRR